MAEQTFQSPGFFEREIDLAEKRQHPVGTPAGVIGTALRGPAFVPVMLGSFADFITKFGNLDPKKFGPYAVSEFLKSRKALTYMRVLGAGANDSLTDIANTQLTGQVKNAGFIVTGSDDPAGQRSGHVGCVQFIAAVHDATTNEAFGMPIFSDNNSIGNVNAMNLLRASVFLASDTKMFLLDGDEDARGALAAAEVDDLATLSSGEFKIVLSSSAGLSYGNDDGIPGVRILSASLNPNSASYIANLLNTDPETFSEEKHFLFADYAVDHEVAEVSTGTNSVGTLSGSALASSTSGDPNMLFRNLYGHFNTRYTTPRTPPIVSQPYGTKEYSLFYVESLDDGDYSNSKYKISISNLKASSDPAYVFGTFTLQVRRFADNDVERQVVEEWVGLSLDPLNDRYIARLIGDVKATFDFDADTESERRIVVTGKYANQSNFIRIVMSTDHKRGLVPNNALPFGYRGLKLLKTNNSLTDTPAVEGSTRLGISNPGALGNNGLSGSIMPPIPTRFKVTKNSVATSGPAGNPGTTEIASTDFYWGAKFERNTNALNPNLSTVPNKFFTSLTKFSGIEKLDALVTGSAVNTFNNNSFSMSRVALRNTALTDLTASVGDHMREAAYIRNAVPDSTNYTINDGVLSGRLSMGTLLAQTSSFNFNRFIDYNKFTLPMYGGFNGNNMLDKNSARMNDKATSVETGGGAALTFQSPGLAYNCNGTGKDNNGVMSYRSAINMMTDPWTVNTNILAIPGVREPLVTNHAADSTRDYGKAIYLMDIPQYDESGNRLFYDRTVKPDVEKTEENFVNRAVDNNYAATYFPDIQLDDVINTRRVTVPSSIAAIAALGFNDRVAFPWFAPAGFNRAALSFVKNVDVRLSSGDRDRLYESRINPIATFPREGFVIWGQKTLQQRRSALDRINVRRMLLEVKRIIGNIALGIVFEPNNAKTRNNFVKQSALQLGIIQAAQGIESFSVIMDSTNNTDADINANRINGRIAVVPTRAVEFIAIDFIITPAGVEFT